MMQRVERHSVRYFNSTYARTGTLWEGRFKSCLILKDQYLFYCYRYIELNPVRAGMVEHSATIDGQVTMQMRLARKVIKDASSFIHGAGKHST